LDNLKKVQTSKAYLHDTKINFVERKIEKDIKWFTNTKGFDYQKEIDLLNKIVCTKKQLRAAKSLNDRVKLQAQLKSFQKSVFL